MPASPESTSNILKWGSIRDKMILKERQSRRFLPESALAGLINEEAVSAVLEPSDYLDLEKTELISFICNLAPKVFTILTYIDTQHLIGHFYKCKFDDSRLPVTGDGIEKLGSDALTDSPFRDEIWKRHTKARFEFFESQWYFLSPVFRSDRFRYKLSSNDRMPFVDENCQAHIDSNFSEVEKWRIHCDHLKIESSNVSPTRPQSSYTSS